MKKYILILCTILCATQVFSQSIATGYSVGNWSGFRTSATTFTFDDGYAEQYSNAAPLFDNYGYKASFYVVTNWGPDYSTLMSLVKKGHEVGSHSVTHPSTALDEDDMKNSQTIINENVTNQKCVTITYPNCVTPDVDVCAKYYIGGRICSGQINATTPSDYYNISSLICGKDGSYNSLATFKTSLQNAISAKGWVVYLIHDVDNTTHYSNLASDTLSKVLDYIHENDSKIWVTTFRDAILYSKERNALSLVESSVSSTKYQLTASVNITSSLVDYNYPITVRREMPSDWSNIAVSLDGSDISVTTITVGSTTYAQFDVIPGKTYYLEDRKSEYTESGGSESTISNLLENGEFDDETSYWATQNSSAGSTLSITTSAGLSGTNAAELCPESDNYGDQAWHIQMYQNVSLEKGVEYTYSFEAKASAARTMVLMIQKSAANYDTYLWKQISLTTEKQTFEGTFVAPDTVATDSKFTLCIGGDPNCVYLDNIFFGTEVEEVTENPTYNVDVTDDISQYFVDKAYIGPSCDVVGDGTVTDGAYFTGEYRNLFTEILGKTQAQVDTKIQSIWDHFFTVGGENTVYYESGSDKAYIYDVGNADVRTEGMSYGMMICVQLGHQEEFNKLWRWAKTYMQYDSSSDKEGLFAWQCNTDGSIKGSSCAPDGEAYFLTALFFASHRWGNDGDINYEEEAQYLIKELLDKPGRAAGSVSPIFNMDNYLITFGETSYGFTDPSYNLPGFWELWARWTNTNKSFWAKTPAAARNLLYNAANTTTGLYPDYSNFDGSGYYPSWAGYNTSIYKYDAIRCPMNVGMDYHWFAADSRQQTMMYNILNFFKNDGYTHAYFNVDGSDADGYYSEGQKGAHGVAVFALTDANKSLGKEQLQKLWDVSAPSGTWRYYNGMVYMLSMLHASGNFRIFKPTPEVVDENLSGPSPITFDGVDYTKDTTFKKLIDCKIYNVTITIEATNSFNVIFEDYDGTELKTEVVESGNSATAPTKPTRTGYTFKEWDTDFSNVTKDLTITAVYEINTYTVTFVDYDGTVLKTESVNYGKEATAPTNPTRSGYTFKGWDVDFDVITDDLTVTATYNIKDASTKYEAENATMASGAYATSSSSASGGKYVKMQAGNLTFTVNVSAAGMYNLKFVYSLTESYKAQYLTVNGSQVGTVAFNQSGSTDPTFASVEACVMLNSGSNTVGLENSWGYVDIDYLEISTYERTQFNLDEALVTPKPQPAATEIYEFLKENFGKKTVSGVMTLDVLDASSNTLALTSQSEVSYIKNQSGKYPVVVGFDFMHSTGKNSTNDWQKAYTNAVLAMAKELWDKGGIPTFSWHWRDPNQSGDDFYTKNCTFNLDNAFTSTSYTAWNTSSTEYKNMISDIDIIAGYLKQLQCEGVSILWRPIHEASGAWFWWGSKGATAYKQLYYLLFDRLVNYHKLSNLIWVWNSDGTDADWYPGDNYVDVVGRDFYYSDGSTYNHSSLVCDFEALASQTNGKKLVTLAENGAVPYPENMDSDDAVWSWFMPWYGDYVTSSSHNTSSDWNTIMNDSRVITLSDMTGWDNRTKIYDTTTVGTLYSKNGFSITPTKVGDTENEKTFTSSLSCDSTVVLYLHATASSVVNYTVTFVDYDDTKLDEQEVESGLGAVEPTKPTRTGYTFKEWDTDFSNVTKDLTVKATYTINTYTVTFVDYNGTTIDEQVVNYKESATVPTDPSREGYVFSGWEGSYENVTSDVTITATYTEKDKADYTALNKAIADAESLETVSYTEASVKALQDALAAAKAVDTNLYSESQSIVDAATKSLTDAMSALVVQTFTVTFVDYNGTTIDEQVVNYKESATVPTDPSREGYVFSGWEGSYENVTSDITITATYIEKDKADYTALNKAIADAESLETVSYTEASVKSLQDALAAAKAVDTNLYSESQSVVDAATKSLNDALSALVVQTFTVTFVDYNGTTIDEQVVNYKESATVPTDPSREGYVFSGWEGSYENVTSDVTITATYTEKDKADYTALNKAIADAESLEMVSYTEASVKALQDALTAAKAVDTNLYSESQSVVDAATKSLTDAMSALVVQTFTVTFIADEETISTQTIDYGKSATTPKDPTKTGYDFVQWNGDYENVTADATITAEFKIKSFTVTFVDYNGSTLEEQIVEYGSSAIAPTSPSREGFTFTGWVGQYEKVMADVTITASYTENGKAVYTSLDNVILQAEALVEEKYTTSTWNSVASALSAAKLVDRNLYEEDQSVIDDATKALTDAISSLALQTFTITFIADEETISTQTIEYGESAIAPKDPTKTGYDFVQWNGDYENVITDATITAEFKIKSFIVTFEDYDGSILDEQTIEYGKSATAPTEPSREGYTFSGWNKTFTEITENVTITAQYTEKGKADYTALNKAIVDAESLGTISYTTTSVKALQDALTNAKSIDVNLYSESQSIIDAATKELTDAIAGLTVQTFTVTFEDYDGSILDEQIVEYGKSAIAPKDPSREGYTFSSWNKIFTEITENVTITAQYIENGKADYTALNKAIAQAEALSTESYIETSVEKLTSALASAKSVDTNLYEESQSIIDDATSALNDAMKNLAVKTFNVTFVADDKTIDSQVVDYGKSAIAPANPTKIGYDFVAWSGDFSNITSDVTIAAEFVIKTYVVSFVDYDNSVLSVQTVEYASNAIAPEEPSRDGYTFSGWNGSYKNVTSDVTITATYTAKGLANYTNLDKAIASANSLKESDYTNTSWSALQNVLESAMLVERGLYEESQAIIDEATQNLNTAINALVKLDRTKLASTISTANALISSSTEGFNKGQYIIGAKDELNAAIISAKTVYETISTSQSQIDEANADLLAAIEKFKASIITADKSQLSLAISKANTALAKAENNTGDGSSQFPYAAVATFENEIANAQQVYETANEQTIIDTKTQTLLDAIQAFLDSQNPVIVDYATLAELVAEATELLNTTSVGEKPGQYALLDYMQLSQAKQTAESMIAKASSTQSDVDEQVVVLQGFIDAYRNSQILSIDDKNENGIEIYTKGHVIVVENENQEDISIFDIRGSLVSLVKATNEQRNEIYVQKDGVYIVKVGTTTKQVIVK